jgi:hypothetical protein
MRYPNGMACVHVDQDSGETLCPTCKAMLEQMPQPELQIVPMSDSDSNNTPKRRPPIEIINSILDDFPEGGEADDDVVPPRLN